MERVVTLLRRFPRLNKNEYVFVYGTFDWNTIILNTKIFYELSIQFRCVAVKL